jgi:hypothetical protein
MQRTHSYSTLAIHNLGLLTPHFYLKRVELVESPNQFNLPMNCQSEYPHAHSTNNLA